MQPISLFIPQLQTPSRIVITTHQKPDGDAMGSSLGLAHFLQQQGHAVQVISPTNWADFLDWMPGVKQVWDYEAQTAKSDAAILEANYVFCLDFNTLGRVKRMEAILEQTTAQRILIDHHREPQTEKFAFGASNIHKSSTAEMVYDFIVEAGGTDAISKEIADCLYAGVMTDTGSFRFPATTPSVHRMVATLMEKGMEPSPIHEALFDNFLENRLRFFGHVISQRLEFFYEYNTALIAVPQADLIKYNIKTGDTEGLVNYPLSIKGIKLAAIIIDRGEERKCSFRSKGGFDVNVFARSYFNGGGHAAAAGGQSREPFDTVVKRFHEAMRENKDKLSDYTF